MQSGTTRSLNRLVEYDALRRRLYIKGQRCHHGSAGAVVAVAAFLALIADPAPATKPVSTPRVSALAAAAGAFLMMHDWKDRALWFERGRGSQS